MIVIQPVTPLNVEVFKSVRLRALLQDSRAFSSTYEKEAQFSEAEWLTRVERMNGERGVGFLAMEGEVGCGIVGCFLSDTEQGRAQVVSMWTAPAYRKQGVGHLLINEVIRWAGRRDCKSLQLMVTSVNEPAILFYEGLGFTRTGRSEPYPNDPTILQYEMSLSIL